MTNPQAAVVVCTCVRAEHSPAVIVVPDWTCPRHTVEAGQ